MSEGAGRRRRGGKENTLAVFCVKREKRSGATDGDARACAVGETRGRESRSNTISARGTIARGGASDDVNLGSPAEAPRSPSVSRDIQNNWRARLVAELARRNAAGRARPGRYAIAETGVNRGE